MAQPKKGDTVLFRGMPVGTWQVSPAVVTRVYLADQDTAVAPVTVNLTVFPDGSAPVSVPGVRLFHTAEQAVQHRDSVGRVFAAWLREEVTAA